MIDLQFEDDIGRVTRGEARLMLRKFKYRIFKTIAVARGKMVDWQVIALAAYGPESTASRKLVEVHISQLRRRIKPLGLEIIACKGVGYGLAEARR